MSFIIKVLFELTSMFCINLESNDPFFNLSLEELLLKNRNEEYFILGLNIPSVIIGKHQSAHREVNTKYIFENNIPVVRRISGGGTVFHDMGNLNFTFIRKSESGKQIDFIKYTQPVIGFLLSSGIEAKFEGKNDIKVEGFKISGNAEHVYRNRVLHHGTLLFSTSLEMMNNSIRKDKSSYTSRAVESNPSTVANMKDKLQGFKDIYELKSGMMEYLLEKIPESEIYALSHQEIEETELLAYSKYRSWEWNWAYGPEYSFLNSFYRNGILHSCRFFVRDGIIRECTVEGSDEMVIAGKKLTGCRHMVTELLEVFNEENILITDGEIFNFF